MLPIIFLLPIIQLVILSNAATFEIKNIKFSYIDNDHSRYSRALIDKFKASKYFNILAEFPSNDLADKAMLKGEVDIVLEIPAHFERDLVKENHNFLGITINAIDGAAAGVEKVYLNQIVRSFNKNIQLELMRPSDLKNRPNFIETIPLFWYNKTLNYKTFMVPGILVLLVTMIALFLSGMNIVREKEMGTLEQINVTPIGKIQFIIGKLFPFWVIGMVLLTVGLVISKIIFNIPIVGSLALLYFYTSIYLLAILGIGLFISNFTDTQQQAMFIAWFFIVIFILMSGLFTPIESMPKWAQFITDFNPIKYYVQVMRMIMLKGSDLNDIMLQLIRTIIYAVVMNVLAVMSYRKAN